MTPDRKQAKQDREERKERMAMRSIRWRQAERARASWTEDDHLAEAERLDAEIAAMIENGGVTVIPSGGSPGAGSSDTRFLMAGWVITAA